MPTGTPLNSAYQFVKCFDACCSADAAAVTSAPAVIVAGGGLDALKFIGQTIDRKNGTALAHACKLATQWLAALTDTKSLSLTIELQESPDGSAWNAAEAVQAVTVEQLAVATTNYRGVNEQEINLMSRERYIRFNVTGTMSHTSTDEASFGTVASLVGWDQTPVS